MRGRDIAVALITARETAKQVSKELVKPITVEIQPIAQQKKITKISTEKNVAVKGTTEIVDEKASGELTDLLLITDSDLYKLRVYRDEEQLYADTYTWFSSVAPSLKNIVSQTEVDEDGNATGNYILALKNINFSKHIRVLMDLSDLLTPFTIGTLHYELLENSAS